jgi:hypothetical protein
MDRFPCHGRLKYWIPNNGNGCNVNLPGLINLQVPAGNVLLHFRHAIQHTKRFRNPVPQNVREFIQNPIRALNCKTTAEMVKQLEAAIAGSELEGIDIVDITDDNVRYWLLQVRRQLYERHSDPWRSAVSYLQERENVEVHDYTNERRKMMCWYFPAFFGVALENVTEIYVDATMGTNTQNAELYGIVVCENGYGIPVGYMLMEKKPTEDSKTFPGEVTEACTRFFTHAKELNLVPIIVHTDKAQTELAAAKVFDLDLVLISLTLIRETILGRNAH